MVAWNSRASFNRGKPSEARPDSTYAGAPYLDHGGEDPVSLAQNAPIKRRTPQGSGLPPRRNLSAPRVTTPVNATSALSLSELKPPESRAGVLPRDDERTPRWHRRPGRSTRRGAPEA